MTRPRARGLIVAVLVTSMALGSSACSGDDESETSAPPSIVEPSTNTPIDSTTPVDVDIPADVTASGVLLAATLFATGNIDDAVASGLVTPAEVDEARKAIENGSLDRWVALAEGR